MKKFILGGLGAAGVAYAVLHLIYGQAEYAAVGPISVGAGIVTTVGPLIAGVLWPLLAARFPVLAGLLKTGLSLVKRKKPSAYRDVILQITELEVADAEAGIPTTECSAARTAMLRRITTSAKAA